LKQLDEIARRILQQDLRSARSSYDIVAELDVGGAQPRDLGRNVLHDEARRISRFTNSSTKSGSWRKCGNSSAPEARRLIAGAAYAYKTEAEAAKTSSGLKQFAGAHGTPAQRFYNLLCLAYGADPQLFGDIVEKGHLPKERAEGCKEEYQQVSYAFQQLIGPHLDPVLAKEVMDKTWLPDAKWRMQRSPGSE
jgi:hypothetical protein